MFAQYRLPTSFDEPSGTLTHAASKPSLSSGTWRHSTHLGTGSFASVRRETNDASGAVRAVKLVSKAALTQCSVDYTHELGVLIAVKDRPEFVAFHGWFEDAKHVYFAMDFAAHGDLEQLLAASPARARAEVKTIAKQLLAALAVLHGLRILHRDIKPKNILIASLAPLRLQLADFGLSTQDPRAPLPHGCGTTRFQAPELLRFVRCARGGSPFAADVWAAGVVVYLAATGAHPFFAPRADEVGVDMNGSWGITSANLAALQRYCDGAVVLAAGGLEERGVRFVRRLLCADPAGRVGPREAMGDVWLRGRTASVAWQVRMAMGVGVAGGRA